MGSIIRKIYLVILLAIVTIVSCATAPANKSNPFNFDSLFHYAGRIKKIANPKDIRIRFSFVDGAKGRN